MPALGARPQAARVFPAFLLLAGLLAGCLQVAPLPDGGQQPGSPQALRTKPSLEQPSALPPARGTQVTNVSSPVAEWPQYSLDNGGSRDQQDAQPWSLGDFADLTLVWTAKLGGAATDTPAVVGGKAYVGSWDRHVYAFDAASGAALWNFSTLGRVDDSPAVVDGGLYVGDSAAWLYRLDAASGTLVWKAQLDPEPASHLYSSPLVWNGTLYIGVASDQESVRLNPKATDTFHGSIVAVDMKDGRILWRSYVQDAARGDGTGGSVWSSPALDPVTMRLYVTTGNAYGDPEGPRTESIIALDARTGKEVWGYQAHKDDVFTQRDPNNADWDFGSSPTLADRSDGHLLVMAAQKSGQVWAIEAATGKVAWVNGQPLGDDGAIASPAERDGTLFVAYVGQQKVRAIRIEDGTTLWDHATGAPMYSAPALVGGAVVVGTSDGRLLALDHRDGHEVANLTTGRGGIFGGISIAEDTIFATSVPDGFMGKDGALLAWRPT